MCGKRVENLGENSRMTSEFQGYPELQYNETDHVQNNSGGGGGGGGVYGGVSVPEATILPWSTIPEIPSFVTNPVQFSSTRARDHENFLACMTPSSSSSSYQGFHRTALQFGYDNSHEHHQITGCGMFISDPLAPSLPGSSSLGLEADFGKMTTQEIVDAKAIAASKSHSEAERRRRERINKHLATLRSLLPNTTKTDKASLLAEVIQHVKELKRQTSEIAEGSPVPTEIDELTIDSDDSCGDGKFVIRASLCCEDRSDLLPDLIKTLKALRLRTIKAEIATLGGRVKNVLLVTGEDDSNNDNQTGTGTNPSIGSIQDALKAVMERAVSDDSSAGNIKRQRTNISIVEHRSI